MQNRGWIDEFEKTNAPNISTSGGQRARCLCPLCERALHTRREDWGQREQRLIELKLAERSLHSTCHLAYNPYDALPKRESEQLERRLRLFTSNLGGMDKRRRQLLKVRQRF